MTIEGEKGESDIRNENIIELAFVLESIDFIFLSVLRKNLNNLPNSIINLHKLSKLINVLKKVNKHKFNQSLK